MRRRLILAAALALGVIASSPTEGRAPVEWSPVSDDLLRPLPEVSPSPWAWETMPPDGPLIRVDPVVRVNPARPSRKPLPAPAKPRAGALLVRGWATFYDARGAAASRWLARALGGGRRYLGRTVWVCVGKRCLPIRLITSCACGDRHGKHTVIDLPRSLFIALVGSTGPGVVWVEVKR